MTDRPVYYSPLPSSHHLQETRLQQYLTTAMSIRERDRSRLSPEPRHEIMRPVSPFQNKRHPMHQQAQVVPRSQLQSHSHVSVSQPYTQHTNRPTTLTSRAQDVTHSTRTTHRTRPRQGVYKENEGTQKSHREADITPALRMMNFEKAITPPSSDAGHSQTAHSLLQVPSDKREQTRSTSPETGRRRNPGWRKPAPKYIPTPPSTPPTTMYERLPSRNDSVPLTVTTAHPVPVRAPTEPPRSHSPPSRPQRVIPDQQTPIMFRDMTSSFDHSRNRAPIHQPTKSLVATEIPNRTQNISASISSSGHNEVPTQRQPALTVRIRPPSSVSNTPMNVVAKSSQVEARSGGQRAPTVHPQPKKVPSLTQLVAKVLPSRTPSPVHHPSKEDISVRSSS